MNIIDALLYSLAGGLVPSLIWLWFWLHEDRLHPEPKRMIMFSFIAGMIAVVVVTPFEQIVYAHTSQTALTTFTLYAIIEECCKYWAASWSALKTRYYDEPVDAVIYMISTALGFAALENGFFILNYLRDGEITKGVLTTNLRFMGANLLHIIASAIIGIFIAYAFYKRKLLKRLFLMIGFSFAITLHTLFNFSIIKNTGEDSFQSWHGIMMIFGLVWLLIIVLILMIERVKMIKNPVQNIN